jgi:hypothetical protein
MSCFGISAKPAPPAGFTIQESGFSRQDSGKDAFCFSLNPESRILFFPEPSNSQIVILHYENWGYKQARPQPIESLRH